MRLPKTIGVELPVPGTGTFQAMFSDSLQLVGGLVDAEAPDPSGPRH